MDRDLKPTYISRQNYPSLNETNAPMAALALHQFFREHRKIALAFSGGADSALVLYTAKKMDCDIKPYFVRSQFQPCFEQGDAQRLCKELGVMLTVVNLDILATSVVAQNPPDRCYYCKRRIFEAIASAASQGGYALVIDGTNASDNAAERSGMRALQEFKIRSPLAECHITKAQVRYLSRSYGLFTWDKPAYACLATRVPTGQEITEKLLSSVERGEDALRALGFTDFRLRVMNQAARLQVPENQMSAVLAQREAISQILLPEFSAVLLDLIPRQEG